MTLGCHVLTPVSLEFPFYVHICLIVYLGGKKSTSKKENGSNDACGTCRDCDDDDEGICSQLARRILVGVTY